jgi:hypothetical protein
MHQVLLLYRRLQHWGTLTYTTYTNTKSLFVLDTEKPQQEQQKSSVCSMKTCFDCAKYCASEDDIPRIHQKRSTVEVITIQSF